MTKEELLRVLTSLYGSDPETEHATADQALLDFINDEEIRAAFDAVQKWYA